MRRKLFMVVTLIAVGLLLIVVVLFPDEFERTEAGL